MAPLAVVLARARRRPGRFVLPLLGIALATAFAGTVAAEGTVAADHGARSVLRALPPLQRVVQVTWQGPVSTAVAAQARALLGRLGLGQVTQVVLLEPVRLSGVVVRPAAISPLGGWLPGPPAARLGACRTAACPMLVVSGGHAPASLGAAGVRIDVVGAVPLRSSVPLGFAPAFTAGPPVLLTGDAAGLESLAGLNGVYRTHSWLASIDAAALPSWDLGPFTARLQHAQAALLAQNSQFSLSAPFAGLDSARAQAAAAPQRLLLAGGGAVAALALFIVLASGGLRTEQLAETERLRRAGARSGQCWLFVTAEAGGLCATGLVLGAAGAVLATIVLAAATAEPLGGVLAHSLLTPGAGLALAGGWLAATALTVLAVSAPRRHLADGAALAAVAALAAGVATTDGRRSSLAAALAPLGCLAGGLIVLRVAVPALRVLERGARRGPLLVRVALVDLARAPALPALAIAFVAVSTGLGGFALAYRATLVRGAADQAADAVPLDALIAPGADFISPLKLAPLTRWRAVAGTTAVLPVRRTQATYVDGSASVTVPALAIPASGLPSIRGWRVSDGSAPLEVLSRRLVAPGPARVPGPELPAGTGWLGLVAISPELNLSVTADLRDGQGAIRQLRLGIAGARRRVLRARLPPGRWELEALELDEPVGLAITNGHQNGENDAAATQFAARVSLGPLLFDRPGSRAPSRVGLGGWRGVGATSNLAGYRGTPAVILSFQTTGWPGIVRPVQPSDVRPVPVLSDPATAAAGSASGLLALTVNGAPVNARVVGVLRRFPTLGPGAAGFVVADGPALAAALDAQLPGQGEADELWIATRDPRALRTLASGGSFAQLNASFRADVERALRTDPIERGVLGTLAAAAALSAVLAVLGVLVVLRGGLREARIEPDLEAQGFGPAWLRMELRLRLALAGGLGVAAGTVIAVLLTRLSVAAVQAGYLQAPQPPLIVVIPWTGLVAGALVAGALVTALAWLGPGMAGVAHRRRRLGWSARTGRRVREEPGG